MIGDRFFSFFGSLILQNSIKSTWSLGTQNLWQYHRFCQNSVSGSWKCFPWWIHETIFPQHYVKSTIRKLTNCWREHRAVRIETAVPCTDHEWMQFRDPITELWQSLLRCHRFCVTLVTLVISQDSVRSSFLAMRHGIPLENEVLSITLLTTQQQQKS